MRQSLAPRPSPLAPRPSLSLLLLALVLSGPAACGLPDPEGAGGTPPITASLVVDETLAVDADIPVSVTAGSVHEWTFTVTAREASLPDGGVVELRVPPTLAMPQGDDTRAEAYTTVSPAMRTRLDPVTCAGRPPSGVVS